MVNTGNLAAQKKYPESCIRFDELIDRVELSDEEIDFILEHLESCPIGHHTPDGHLKLMEALWKAVQKEE